MEKILFINTYNTGGGAEKVAYGLCKELYLRGYKSKLIARDVNYSADPLAPILVEKVPGGEAIYSVGNLLDDIFSTQYLFYLPTWKIPLMEYTQSADVIHFHNMHGYYFNLLTIPLLMWLKPVVWTLHDMWSFTGKCSNSFECDRFMHSCGKCPVLDAYPKLRRDTTRFHLKLKKILYSRRKFTIISPSEWLRSQIQKSFLRDIPVEVIPSPIDTNIFYPEDKIAARNKLGIPHDKKVLLFVASWVNSTPNKGVNVFKEMLDTLMAERDDIYALIIGHLEGQTVIGDKYVGKETGFISDADTMRSCYSAADLFVTPTLAENSSCTIVEAMACGTVPIAFSVGGVPEQIIDKQTGMLAQRGDIKGLLNAIRALLNDDNVRSTLSTSAAVNARSRFSMDLFIDKHIKIYRTVNNNLGA